MHLLINSVKLYIINMTDNLDDVQNIYDEIEIDDMDFEEDEGKFYYPCPCGDKF